MLEEPTPTTPFDTKCNILSELWIEYRTEDQFKDFVDYNDLGLPLAFAVSEGLVVPNENAIAMINETFVILLATLEIEDAGFESLDDMLVG
jgi:hypothetical protein